MIRCGSCGIELADEFGAIPRLPCPDCKGTLRRFSIAISARVDMHGSDVALIHTRPGTESVARRDDRGNIELTAFGPSPTNEEGTLEICERLVRVLNSKGEMWSPPVKGEQDIDGSSQNPDGRRLLVQVTRLTSDPAFWKLLNKEGTTSRNYVDASAVKDIIAAIRRKADHYPANQKKAMVLVLDTTRAPSHTFRPVLDLFRRLYVEEVKDTGFSQVWLVGSQDSLVARLDQ